MDIPYYIWSPDYFRTSGGVKVLYKLCNDLNKKGQKAYILGKNLNPELNCPQFNEKEVPQRSIAIYPEILFGNPFNSQFVIRYVLNERGITTGRTDYEDGHDYRISFSKKLKPTPETPTLTIPICDPERYKDQNKERSIIAYYVGRGSKNKDFVNATEITAVYPDSEQHLIELLNECKLLYVFCNTGLIQEAVLCGCPVVMVPNDQMKYHLLEQEFGWSGVAWGVEDTERAINTVKQGRENYIRMITEYDAQLDSFIKMSQELAITKLK